MVFAPTALAARLSERESAARGESSAPTGGRQQEKEKEKRRKKRSAAHSSEAGRPHPKVGRSHPKRVRIEEPGKGTASQPAGAPSGEGEVVVLDVQPLQARPCPEVVVAQPVPARRHSASSSKERRAAESLRQGPEPWHQVGASGPSEAGTSRAARAYSSASGSSRERSRDSAAQASWGASALNSANVCINLSRQVRLPADDQTISRWKLGALLDQAYLGAIRHVLVSDQLYRALASMQDDLLKERQKGNLESAVKAAEERAQAAEERARAAEEKVSAAERRMRVIEDKARQVGREAQEVRDRSASTKKKLQAAELAVKEASSEAETLRSELLEAKMQLRSEGARTDELSLALAGARAKAEELKGELRRLSKRVVSAEAEAARVTEESLDSSTNTYHQGFHNCRRQVEKNF